MSNTADVTGGKPIAVWSQSVSGANAINPFAIYDIHGRKREVLLFYFVLDTTRDYDYDYAGIWLTLSKFKFIPYQNTYQNLFFLDGIERLLNGRNKTSYTES
jgi:hypothetical protein